MWYRHILLVIFMVASPALVWGNEFRIVPSISVKEEYNSNILLSEDDIKRDFVATVSPGVEMVNRTGRLDADVRMRLSLIDYARYNEFSATDQAYSGRLRYRITPLFGISAEAAYVIDSRPDQDIQTTGIVLSAEPRHRITSALSADYQFTETTAAGITHNFTRNDFESQSHLDDTSHDLNAGLVHDFGTYIPALKGRMNMGYSYYDTTDTRIDSVVGTIGVSRDIDEVWSVQFDSGIRRAWSDVTVIRLRTGNKSVKEHVENAGWGWVAQASLNYRGERGNGSLSYSRDLRPATGLGGEAVRNAVTLSTLFRPTQELSLLFTADYYTNKSAASELAAQDIDQRTFSLRPGVRYEFSKDMTLEASYEYTTVDNKVSNMNPDRQLFFVRFSVQHAFFE